MAKDKSAKIRSYRIDDFYDSVSIMDSSKRGYYKEKIDFIVSELKRLGGSLGSLKMLDIACNDGELTRCYSEYGEVVGIDINRKAINKCRKKGLKCILTDVQGLPEKFNNFFDVVIAGDIIEHIFNTDEFLTHIKRVLKRDGILLLTTPNLASLGRRLMLLVGINPYIEFSNLLPSKEYNVGHIRYYTIDNMLSQLRYNDFKRIRIVGDKINLSKCVSISHCIAKYFPSLSRNLMVYAQKS